MERPEASFRQEIAKVFDGYILVQSPTRRSPSLLFGQQREGIAKFYKSKHMSMYKGENILIECWMPVRMTSLVCKPNMIFNLENIFLKFGRIICVFCICVFLYSCILYLRIFYLCICVCGAVCSVTSPVCKADTQQPPLSLPLIHYSPQWYTKYTLVYTKEQNIIHYSPRW